MPLPFIAIGLGAAALGGGIWANRKRSQEAQKDRNFQERMSSTSWQRGKADMERAGINPALAYSRGGASSPGGAMAGVENITEGAVTSAMQAKRMQADLKLIQQQTQTSYYTGQAQAAAARKGQAEAHRAVQLEMNDEVQNRILRLQLPWMDASAKAIGRFPQAAMMQLILNSGGTQALGLTGLGAASRIFRPRRGR